jgi:iron-sulfur cluster assembly accessory protein
MTLQSVTIQDDTPQVETAIHLTEAAAGRVRSLIEEKNLPGHALRVFVSGGGCSGMQYGMALEGQPRPNDLRFTFSGVDVVVDPLSIDYLAGSTIDYIDDLMGGGFKIENPNAVSSCGCGHSFRTAAQSAGGTTEAGAGAGCNC